MLQQYSAYLTAISQSKTYSTDLYSGHEVNTGSGFNSKFNDDHGLEVKN